MTPIEVIRAAAARREARRNYLSRYEQVAELEQRLFLLGEMELAEGAHHCGVLILRAYVAETDDPAPEGLR